MAARIQNALSWLIQKRESSHIAAMGGLLAVTPMLAFADNTLVPSTSEFMATNTPYAVLDISPGVSLVSAQESIEGYFDQSLAAETVTMNARSANGREFQYEYVQRLVSPWVTPTMRMGNAPYEEIVLPLATDALDRRVLGVHRTVVATENDRPSAEAVFEQVKEAFGPPSYERLDAYESHMLYLHSSDGLISDLVDLDRQTVAASGEGNLRSLIGVSGGQFDVETPCITAIGRPAAYQFKYPRSEDPLAGCDFVFQIEVQSTGQKTTIRFELIDYALVRQNRDETDRQIIEILEQPQSESEIKL
ncbi:hypothetical protein [uncultured Tateyamaria sp.]|uniref:hypothetical protein n=1 Tax=uncultured Tateyamaria sp. TaxID=455651 RepID=UPI002623955D|nr:hypothetical protein [uncultured Tateyamaria sp.]